MELPDFKKRYKASGLDERNLPANPAELLRLWMNHAREKNIREYNAMVLSTVSAKRKPSSRVVLLKEITAEGSLVFYTNYLSRKGEELSVNTAVSLNFHWRDFERQVRIEGNAYPASKERSAQYFDSRTIESRVSAMISPQSKEIKSLEDLKKKAKSMNAKDVCLPDYWGGYEVVPDYFEFWQGGEHRLHDRIFYKMKNNNWQIGRLAP